MIMKNRLTIAAAIFATVTLTGCLNDFLDKPAHNMTPETELNDIVKMSSSIYNSFLGLNEGQGDALYSMGEIASDNALRGSILSDGGTTDPARQFNQFQNFTGINPASGNFIEALWNGLYPGIDQANINIRAFDRLFPDADPALKMALTAENRFARGWFYMHLVNIFGQVVLLPEDEITPKEYAELTNDRSIPELYEYLVADLRFAADNLPTKQEWNDLFGLDWRGRAHDGSGKGYLAKALLYQAANLSYYGGESETSPEECYREIVQIVSSLEGEYDLYPDYEQIFREAGNFCVESMFEIGTKSTSDGTTRFAGWRPIQPRGYQGYGRLAPTLNLINQYERDSEEKIIDLRYRGTILFGETTPLSGMEHPGEEDEMRRINGDVIKGIPFSGGIMAAGWPNRYCRKSVQPHPVSTTNTPQTNLGGANLKLLRWGEVLLIGAEAACHIGDESNARKWLKAVRKRAGLDEGMVDLLSGEALLEQIWKDKRLEIALEWSNRYFELVRIDKIQPGYMAACMKAKVDDELKGIRDHLDATDGWGNVYNARNFPMTRDNYAEVLPLRNGLTLPRHYTMPISTKIFSTMLNLEQTTYYR